MARSEGPFSRAHFEARVVGRREERPLGLCFVGPISSEEGEADAAAPARSGHAPVVLRRALSGDRYLFDWRRRAAGGDREPRTLVLEVFSGADRERSIELRLEGCRPRRWTGPLLDAVEGGIAFEEIELEYDKLTWV